MDISCVRITRADFFAVLAAFFITMFGFALSAEAAVSTNAAASLTSANQRIKASSGEVAIIGFNIVSSDAANEKFASTSIMLAASGGFDVTADLAALGVGTSSGIAMYRDDASAGTNGSFDAEDDVVVLSGAPTFTGATTTLTFATTDTVPGDNTGANAGNDYFLVVQTSSGAVNGRSFTVSIYPGETGFTNVARTATPAAATTNAVTVDTVAPTLNANTTGPANNSTGVPVSTFVHMGFSENMDQTTLNSTNVTFTQGGTPVGAAIRPFPDGFDVVASSPPSYAASSKFAKVTTASTAFFNVSGTSPIVAQGAYTTPTVGDIVYHQFDTFPPEVGLVTDATMTSGTFAINGYTLFRPSQITKFATPAATGAVSAGTGLGVGDLVVSNTTANPTTVRYNWHIVTTAAAVNSSDLRFDNASAAPTYASNARFSKILPAATTTTTTSGQFIATTTLSAGDLVFAKLGSGGDNLGSYAWHFVTTGETVNAPSGTGTTSALRLDGAAAAPHFVGSSVIAKIATAGNAAIDGAVAQDATVFALGDLQFSKVTANASNLNSYNFHFVSNGATGATSTALRLDNASANLTPSTVYVVTATTGVKDSAGNPLGSNATLTFTTGATSGTNTTPPFVQSSQPQQGVQTLALNSPIKVVFSVAMKSDGGVNAVTNTAVVKLSTDVSGAPGTAVAATNAYDSTTNTVTVTPSANLATSTSYVLQVTTAAQSTNDIPLPQEYRLYFRTGSGADSTAPTILGVNPTNNSTGISVSQVFTVGFSEDMNPATITTSSITLTAQAGGASVSGNVIYSPQGRSAAFAPSTVLATSTGYKLSVVSGGSGVKDMAGNALAANSVTYATTTATSDITAPSVSFASADNFGIAITFTETMVTGGGPSAVDNVANYTLESPTGTSISLGGKTVTYDAMTKTARISGLSLTNGSQFKATVATPVQDLAGNGISTSGTPAGNLAFGTVQNSSTTGGQLGPGSGTINQSEQGMNPTRVTPMTRATGATSNYKVEFLVSTNIPIGGQIVLTFPAGFDVSGAAAVSGSATFCNTDLNGPASGAPVMSVVSGDNAAGAITITTGTAATGANSFLCMDLSGIVNSTVPSSSGYQVDVKTRDTAANNRAILETKTASPFFLGQAGSRTLTVNVFNDGNSNSAIDANEGIASVRVFLFSPAIGGNSTSTNSTGVATFSSLADGDYMVGIDPGSLATASSTVTYNSVPQPFTISATNLTKNIIVSGAQNTVTISGTVTGPNGTSVDVFAAGQNGFSKTVLALTGGADAYTLRVAPSTTYNVGIGPAMPEAHFTPGAPPPPPPTFTFMPPPPLTVVVGTTSVSGKNFTLSSANKSISGTVVDSAGSAVSNAGVFARPITNTSGGSSSDIGFGTGGQTNTSGAFTLNVIPGTYLVGVFKPGMPSVPDQQITVPSSGANVPSSLAFKLGNSSSLTISGTVKDNNGDAIPYAGVSGRKITSTSDTTPIGGGQGNFVGGPTDANGAFTLYVSSGTWQIEAYAPGFGKLGSKTVTVSGSSLSGQDFSAQTLTLGTLQGSTTRASTAVQGVLVRAEGANGGNMAVSDSNGSYTMKLPVGTYSVTCVIPGQGDSAPTTGVSVTDGGTTDSHCAQAAAITITVRITDGTSAVTNAFVDARTSTGRGNGTSENTTSGIYGVYTLSLTPGTYTIRAGSPAFGAIGSTASVSTTQTITYTVPTLYTVTGTVTAANQGANNAFVSLLGTPTGQTNTVMFGTQTGSNGTYSLSAPAGTYTIRADKPSYMSSPSSITISGNTTVPTITLANASHGISGTVTLNGVGVSGAFVDAENGQGGFAVAQTDASGAYALTVTPGSWAVMARSIGYSGSAGTITVSNTSPTGQNITLSAISGFTVRAEKQETVTPTQGGLLTNSDIGNAFKLNIPANALGTGSNAGTVKTQLNSAVPSSPSGTVLSKNGVTISAADSSGQPVKNLNDEVQVVVPYTEADIPSGKTEADLALGVYNDATGTYDILSTTVDTANNTLSAFVTHFSDIAPIVSGTPASSVSTPAATAAAASGGGGGGGGGSGSVAVPAARAQIIYPDGRVEYVDQLTGRSTAGASPAATSAGGSAGVSARFTAPLKQGSRGSDVKRLQQLLGVESSGYFGAMTRAAVEQFQIKHGIAKKGEIGFGQLGPKTRAKIQAVFGASAAAPAPSSASGKGTVAILAGTSFVRALNLRATGEDVKLLQTVLNSDADTQVSISGDGAPGKETSLFGRATLKAVQKFQMKHGLAKPGDSGYGNVGPKTRIKLGELLAKMKAASEPAPETTAPSAAHATATSTPGSTATSTATTSATATSSASVMPTTTASTAATTTSSSGY